MDIPRHEQPNFETPPEATEQLDGYGSGLDNNAVEDTMHDEVSAEGYPVDEGDSDADFIADLERLTTIGGNESSHLPVIMRIMLDDNTFVFDQNISGEPLDPHSSRRSAPTERILGSWDESADLPTASPPSEGSNYPLSSYGPEDREPIDEYISPTNLTPEDESRLLHERMHNTLPLAQHLSVLRNDGIPLEYPAYPDAETRGVMRRYVDDSLRRSRELLGLQVTAPQEAVETPMRDVDQPGGMGTDQTPAETTTNTPNEWTERYGVELGNKIDTVSRSLWKQTKADAEATGENATRLFMERAKGLTERVIAEHNAQQQAPDTE